MTGGAWSSLGVTSLAGLSGGLLAGLLGGLLGAFFYGGLWWTIRRGTVAKRRASWFLGSLLVRMSVALLGIYGVGRHSGARMVICLLGFALARPLVLWLGGALDGRGAVRCASGGARP
jgi:F1F0 ATPase subunit 2